MKQSLRSTIRSRHTGVHNYFLFFLLCSALMAFGHSKAFSQNIATRENFSVGIKADGSIASWGEGASLPSPNSDFVAISSSSYHVVGLKTDGSIVCWGTNYVGSCDVPAPNSGFVAVAAGLAYSLGLKADGSVVCWGYNIYGQCNVPAPNSGFVAIAAGYNHSVGLKADGSVVCWGYNEFGQCDVPAPNSGFIAVSAGDYHSMGLKSDSSIVCWGYTGHGSCNVPSPNSGFKAISAGGKHSLGIKADGSVVGWGYNDNGQIYMPAPNSDFIAIVGGEKHSLGLKSSGLVVMDTCRYELNFPGSGAYVELCTGLTDPTGFRVVPNAPVSLAAVSLTSASFTAKWASSVNATGYRIDVSTHSDFSVCDILNNQAVSGGSSNSYPVTGLLGGRSYYYRVRAFNASGVSQNSVTITVITNKYDPAITFNSLAPKTYGDAPFTVSATSPVSGSPITFTSSDNTTATCTGTNGATITILKAGACTIYANQAANDSCNQAPQVSQTLTINPKTLTVSSVTPAGKVYDGNITFTFTTATLSGVINSDDVSVSGTLSFADKNAGTGKALTASGSSLAGVNADNYTLNLSTSATANITKAPITIGITAGNKTYNGNTTAQVTPSVTGGLVTGDVVTPGATGNFSDKNAGTGKTVTAAISISGVDAANYSCNTTATATANITAASLTIGISAQNKLYDGNTSATANASVASGLITGDVVTVSASNGHFDTRVVGTGKTVTSNVAISGGADAGNYTANTTATTTANITQAPLTVTLTAQDKSYDGNANAIVSAQITGGLAVGDNVTVSAANGKFGNKNAGANKDVVASVLVQGTDLGNYTVNTIATPKASITKASLVVDVTAQNKVYDGTTNATATASVTSGLIAGDVVTPVATGHFDTKNAGTGKTVSIDISLSGTDAENYTCNSTATDIANISQAPLVAGISAQNKVYDGTTVAIVTPSFVSGYVTGDDVTINTSNSVFDNKNAGSGKTVTAGISLSGADAVNYTSNTNATSTADIIKADLIADIDASLTSIFCKGGTSVDFTITYPAAIDAAEGSPYLRFIGTGVRDSVVLSSTDNITWSCHWTSPDTIEGIVNLSVALQDAAGNYKQSSTGTTLLILQNTPNGISEIASNDILVYPTVNQGRFSIAMNNSVNSKVNVRIVNLWGVMVKECQFVKTGPAAIFEVSMDSAPAGEYLVEVRMKSVRELRRVIKE